MLTRVTLWVMGVGTFINASFVLADLSRVERIGLQLASYVLLALAEIQWALKDRK